MNRTKGGSRPFDADEVEEHIRYRLEQSGWKRPKKRYDPVPLLPAMRELDELLPRCRK